MLILSLYRHVLVPSLPRLFATLEGKFSVQFAFCFVLVRVLLFVQLLSFFIRSSIQLFSCLIVCALILTPLPACSSSLARLFVTGWWSNFTVQFAFCFALVRAFCLSNYLVLCCVLLLYY